MVRDSVIFLSGINTPSNTLIPLDASLSTGAKMSKSLGNVVDPVEILKKYTADTVRFYMIRETYYGDDAPFNQEHMEDLHNSNLADAVSPRSSTPSNTIEYKLTPIKYKLTPPNTN